MEFEKWELSGTLRELVRGENVKHELSLLAVQQEKVNIVIIRKLVMYLVGYVFF